MDAEWWLDHASTFEVGTGRWNDPRHQVLIQKAKQRDGTVLWAVRDECLVLGKDGAWDEEPMPSNRTDAFFANFRFSSKDEALAAFHQHGAYTWRGEDE